MAVAEDQELSFFSRSNLNDYIEDYRVVLEASDRRWLREKETLVLGISVPDDAPFEITNNEQGFEGITADYAGLLAQLLQVRITVRRFDSRSEVIQALKRNEVDFVGTANGFEAADPELSMSQAYVEDQPMLVTRSGDKEALPADLAGKKIAMLYHYLPPETVKAFYRHASLQLYPSALSAIGAVAFGQADVYLGDAISANSLMRRHHLNNVQFADFSRLEVSDFSFAFAASNTQLLRIVNAALAVVPKNKRNTILRRWGAIGTNIPGLHSLNFTPDELHWLELHPRLKVAINENLAPLSFFNEKGELRGLTADVLTQVRLRTGLKFEAVRGDTVNDLMKLVASGEADILAALTPTTDRAETFDFTRPYLTTPFVLVSPIGEGQPNTLEDMAGKRLALLRGSLLRDFLTTHYPDIRLVDAQNSADVMAMVARGEVEAGLNALIGARYLISQKYRDRLRITSTVGMTPSRVTFAMARGNQQLLSILNKALLSITPDEMDELINRWRADVVINDSYWLRNRATIIQGFSIAALLLLSALGWVAYLRSLIRKRQQAEQALSDQLEFMRVLIDGTPHPIYVCDRNARLLLCNAGYLDVYGVTHEGLYGKTLIEGLPDHSSEVLNYHLDALAVIRQGSAHIQDRLLTLPDGRVLTIYHWMLPYRGRDGEVSRMIGGWIDISERQQLLEQVQEAKQAADDANRAKSTFLATMSHEIRTPMNAVIGMLELAMKRADEGVLDRFALEVASGAAQGLLGLIGDILDIARIESGRLSLEPGRANLQEMVKTVLRMLDGLARQKHLNLVLELEPAADCDVLVDALRFKQILSNLLSNAIKFTDHGEVRVTLGVQPAQDSLALRLRVEDSGQGISPEDQQRLFNPFIQARNSSQSAGSGSGLGLVICRTLCEMMQGTLTLSSTLGEGTQVEVELVLPMLEPLSAAPVTVPELKLAAHALNILVVDDYPANRLLLSQQLSYLGHRVRDAEDGKQGWHDWLNNQFDVVITDCSMPIMDGYELARAIRMQEPIEKRQPCKILGFTANAQPEEKARCRDAGMDDCLFKPISLLNLQNCLALVEPWTQKPFWGLPSASPDIDFSDLEQLARGSPVAIQTLLNELSGSNQKDWERLLKLYARRDLPGLSDLAHRIKGGVRIIKANKVIAACEWLELACACREPGEVTAAVDALQQAMEFLRAALSEQTAIESR
ncbi:transporter substrate-binding domain-containing protein [Pseudomonas marginalis]|uniref:transporter substrate-binding domain-containing protein n=1 Tax=Pseudomonas marginalis TaxID=298 RepID=UPI003BA19443